MVSGFFKWIFRHFFPYLAGIFIGVGFFFLLDTFLPMLPAIPVVDWSGRVAQKTVAPSEPIPQKKALPPLSGEEAPLSGEKTAQTTAMPTEPPSLPAPVVPLLVEDTPASAADQMASLPEEIPEKRVEEPSAPLAGEQKAVERLSPRAKAAQPALATKPAHEGGKPLECGVAPKRPGINMDRYLACQWRADCLNRLERARRLIEQDKRRCPTSGNNAQACLAYYRALAQQYHASLCSGWSMGRMPGWW